MSASPISNCPVDAPGTPVTPRSSLPDTRSGASSAQARPPPECLSESLRALAGDFAPHRGRGSNRSTRLQYGLLGRLFAAQQRAFESMTPAGRTRCHVEGVRRLYLGTRGGLPFHDTFPVVGAVPSSGDAIDATVRAVVTLARLSASDPVAAARLRRWRRAASGCDSLEREEVSAHFALLRGGELFGLPLSLAGDERRLRSAVETIVRRAPARPGFSIGEGSALPRERWAAIEAALAPGSAPARALDTMRRAAFLVCLDDRACGCRGRCDRALPDDPLAPERFSDRYFDKGLQIIVGAGGTIGLLCEHGGIDGGEAIELIRRLSATAPRPCPSGTATGDVRLPTPLRVDLAPVLEASVVEASRACMAGERASAERRVRRLTDFPCTAFDRLGASIDAIVQIGVQIAFRRCTGRLPSVYEPVRPPPASGRRLAFVSPVSEASARVDDALRAGRPRAGLAPLDTAIEAHRAAVRRGRQGRDGLSHLLALGVAEHPVRAARGVRVQRRRERLCGGLSRALAYLSERDLTVSCGGYAEPVTRFGTIAHRPNMGAIGYVVDEGGLTLDTLLHGRLREELSCQGFADTLSDALHDLLACRRLGVES